MDKFSLSDKKVVKLRLAPKLLIVSVLLKLRAAKGEHAVAVKPCRTGCYPPAWVCKKKSGQTSLPARSKV